MSVIPGVVRQPTVTGLPEGYLYGITRYADIILKHAFPTLFDDIQRSLEQFRIDFTQEIAKGGGSRAAHTARFNASLYAQGWSKHNVTVENLEDGEVVFKAQSHEIDVFKRGEDGWYPGVAVEMEWNNKDPFYAVASQ